MPIRDSGRQLSKDVLGREHAMGVAEVFLGTTDVLDIDEVVNRSSVPRTTVFKELELLARIGALHRFQEQRNLYHRSPSPYWPFVEALLAQAHRPVARVGGDRGPAPEAR